MIRHQEGLASNSPAATLRPAKPEDIPAVGQLLSHRDGRRWDDTSTHWFVHGLDPARCLAWLAVAGDRPVGVSTMFLRRLEGPSGPVRAGYWANLFIDPDYRSQMLYPRLPFAMFEAARRLDLRLLYGAVRLQDLASAHVRIGFGRVGTIPVLMKPLRPARLLAKYRGWGPLRAVSTPLDRLYGEYLRLHDLPARRSSGITTEEIETSGPEIEQLASALRATARERICDTWTAESLRYRYRQTREGTRYQILGARRGGDLLGAVVFRVAERGDGILAGILMDLIARRGRETDLGPAVLDAERRAVRSGCEIMLFLSGLGPEVVSLLSRLGYRPAPERYDFLVWPKQRLVEDPYLAVLGNWRFAFADHDAF